MAELRELIQAAEDALHAVREAVEAEEVKDAPAPEVVPEATPAGATPVTPSEPVVIPVTDGTEVPTSPLVTPEVPEASVGPAVAPSDAPLPV